ncbi:MAG: c-type cytochrome domain-containing protein, partial [Pirellulaceae bacterium]
MNNKFLIPWKSSDLCAGLLTIVLAIMPGVAFCQSKDSATSKQQPWGETPAFEQKTRKLTAPNMKTFFSTYCLRCHGPEESEGGFRADRLAPQIGAVQDIEHWKSVLDVLVTGDMPPEDEVQPQSTELLAAIEQLESFVRDSRGAFLGDGINRSVRRLNQREYANVIDDL